METPLPLPGFEGGGSNCPAWLVRLDRVRRLRLLLTRWGGAAFAGSPVPIGLWFAHAFTHGDTSVALGLEVGEHVVCETGRGGLVDIVSDSKTVTAGRATLGLVKNSLEVVLCDLDVR